MRKKKQKLSKIPSSITTNATRKLSRDNGKKEVWVTDYSSNHELLLVGEGDFSFSCSLATSFGSASNICASSLDSYDDVVRKYSKARSNLNNLKRLGALLLYGVDATKLQIHPHLSHKRFDKIIFNFPHAGFHGKESDPYLIRKHRELVFGFFHSASHMLRADGQVHVSHKNKEPFCLWNIEELASRCFLALVQCVAFKKTKYPGYENKRGDGSRCDESFLLGESNTFKFRFSYAAKELYAEKVNWRAVKEREPEYPQAFSNNRPVSFDRMYPQGVSQRRLAFDISHSLDHNHRQVQDHLIQSRGRTSPLDLSYYQEEHRRSQFEEASIRATQRRGLFAQEENLMSTETSRFQYQDFPLQAIHHALLIRTLEHRQKDALCFLKNRSSNALTVSMGFLLKFMTGKDGEC
ncbi:unnamed protein product [Cochlearia groenlandica]